jgi:hypothetical protein
MEGNAMSKEDQSPYQRLADLLIGAKLAIALRAMAEYRIADKLANGPMQVDALARETGLAPEPLRRVLRGLAQFDVFRETADGRFENSNVSEYMREDAVQSLRAAVLFLNHDVSLRAWLELEETLKDGRSRFVDVNGAALFKLFDADERLNNYFTKCMVDLYGAEAAKIAVGYPFGQFENIIDIGGGQGHILAAILAAHKGLRGTLFDIAPTAALARDFLRDRGLSDRCDVVGGDFFSAIPRGYDAYLVKSVLHDWDDAKATEILKRCREVMAENSRLLIIEEIITPGQVVGNTNRFVDLDLLIHFGGKERTKSDYCGLMRSAGFSLKDIVPVKDSFFSVVEGIPT